MMFQGVSMTVLVASNGTPLTAGLHTEWCHCACLRLYWYDSQYWPSSFTRTHLLLTGNITVHCADFSVMWQRYAEWVPSGFYCNNKWRLSGTTGISWNQKGKTSLDLLEQEIVSGSGISWAICKSAPCFRQIIMPAAYHSVFTGQMPFLEPNQQRQSTEGKWFLLQWLGNTCSLHGVLFIWKIINSV